MPDLIISASAPQTGIAIAAAITTDLVAEIRSRHDLSPLVTAAVGRLTTGAALLGMSLKGSERITLQMSGDGPVGSIAADAWLLEPEVLGARGYAAHPHADLPLNAAGKFDVAGALGAGSLQVTKSYDVGQPYVGIVPFYSGEVAEDLASYLVNSEQIPSVVALGVLANPDGVLAAGGACTCDAAHYQTHQRRRRRARTPARARGSARTALAPYSRRALHVHVYAREG
jgi:molecular chaperone Hsp33